MKRLSSAATVMALVAGGYFLAARRRGHDELFVPYALTGMRVEFCAVDRKCSVIGELEGSYDEREQLKSDCHSIAASEAQRRGLSGADWSYICCTTTADSCCATKVR
jgi:hypothetical protein